LIKVKEKPSSNVHKSKNIKTYGGTNKFVDNFGQEFNMPNLPNKWQDGQFDKDKEKPSAED